jgi:L-alanine-DL-glutamate epimerase-like enolase superfamily enzyme
MASLERVTVYRLKVPLGVPYRLAFGPVEHYDTLVVECVGRDGGVGLGEATVLTGYTDETIEDSWRAARDIATGLAALDPAAARRRIGRIVHDRPFTATAFGTALDMLEASPHLAIERETPVPILALLGATGGEAMHAEFESLLADGYRTIKVKIGFDVAKDIAHVRAVQKVVRGRARIRIDANQGYTAEQGIAFVKALDPADVELFEQPCPARDWDAHLAVVRAAAVPMMLDESIYGIADVERAAALGAARFIKVKLMKLGTLDALAQALERIRALGMRPVLGNGVACDLGCWMEACVAARHIDNAGEMNGFLKAQAQLLTEPLEVRDGAIRLVPGFAPRLAVERLAPFVVEQHVASARTTAPAGRSGGVS